MFSGNRLNMPVWFVLICGSVLERKRLPEKLPESGKVAQKLPSMDSLTLVRSFMAF